MVSKQLNFFHCDEDKLDFEIFFNKRNCKIILNDSNQLLESFSKIPKDCFQVYLINDFFLNEIRNNKELSDDIENPILELGIGGFYPYSKDVLNRARFYYIIKYYENGTLISKSKDFVDWSNNLVKDFKKEFLQKYSKEKTFLYTKRAIEWIENNNAQEIEGGLKWQKN